MIRAHQHAVGASGSDGESESLGYSEGGFSTKIHLCCEGNGKPVTFLLTVGQRNEAVMFESLMEQVKVNRLGWRRLPSFASELQLTIKDLFAWLLE